MRDTESSGRRFRLELALGAAFVLAAAFGCDAIEQGEDGFSDEEWVHIRELEPLPTAPPMNPHNLRGDEEALAVLGHRLFHETGMTEPLLYDGPAGKMGELKPTSCFTCHDSKYMVSAERIPIWQGAAPVRHSHDIPSIVNMGWYDTYLWFGLFDSITMHNSFGSGEQASPLGYAKFIAVNESYRNLYNELFAEPLDPALDPMNDPDNRFPDTGGPGPPPAGLPWAMMDPADQLHVERIRNNLARAMEAHMRRLQTPNSPFKRYVQGDHTQLNAAAKRGLRLFIGKAACNECHKGPLLSDGQNHNIGVPSARNQTILTNVYSGNMMTTPLDQGRAGIVFIQFADCLVPNMMDPSLCVVRGPFANYTAGGLNADPPNFNFSDATGQAASDARAKFAGLRARDCQSTVGPCIAKPELVGAFRTPSLLNIAETGPYFHTGEVNTLEDVVWHYNRGGGSPGSYAGTKSPRMRPLGLTDAETSDLVEFMRSLTAEIPLSPCAAPDPIGKWFVPPPPPVCPMGPP